MGVISFSSYHKVPPFLPSISIKTAATASALIESALYATTHLNLRTSPASYFSASIVANPNKKITAAQLIQPQTTSSEKNRERAYNAMKRIRVQRALLGVDSALVERFGEQFVTPLGAGSVTSSFASIFAASIATNSSFSTSSLGSISEASSRQRPKGRPEYVPGAMNLKTHARYKECQDVLEMILDLSSVSDEEVAAIVPYLVGTQLSSESKVANAGASDSSTVSLSKRGQQWLSLPSTASENEANGSSRHNAPFMHWELPTKRKHKITNGMDLHKYYKTSLLTADEEYSLGMKVQFMMKCEQVHDGLAASLSRLPTMEEWARSCGFTDPDPWFVEVAADEQLRPAGSELLFDEFEPNRFVGNGLAHANGPGRGRGRAKKRPSLFLEDFYDDSDYLIAKNSGSKKANQKNLQPVNRGTVTDFVDALMNSHEAKQRMVQSNMRLVVSISRKYSNVGVSHQDLVQEGSLGLSRAAEKFDPKRGFKFSTYASWWIQQAVFRSIAYHSRTIRLPVHVHNLLNRIRKIRSTLNKDLGRVPTNAEIAAQLGMTVQKYNKVLQITKRSISLEVPKYKSNPKDLGHESEDLLGDTISSTSLLNDETTPQKQVDHNLFHEDLKEMLKILDDDERSVISARYGLGTGLTRTVTAVAAQMKQSKAWVRSQECRALRKLRRPWYEKKLKEHQDALTC